MYYINPNVKDLYRVKFHDKRGEVLRLDMNENPVGLPLDFVEEVKKKITPASSRTRIIPAAASEFFLDFFIKFLCPLSADRQAQSNLHRYVHNLFQ